MKSSTGASSDVPTDMPDYVGTDYDDAKAALSEWNVSVTKVGLVSPQPVGTVVKQDPAAGKDFQQKVTLTVSIAPPEVPDVTDKKFGEAEAELEALGFTVVENPVVDSTRDDGTVVKQDPAAGVVGSGQVTLDVVRRPEATWLADMAPVSNPNLNVTPGSQKANAKTYTHGVAMRPGNGVGSVEYDFSRSFTQLTGELGLDDKSDSDASAKVEIITDGRSVASYDVPFGTTVPVSVDVTNALRVKINVTVTGGPATVIFGDFKAQGQN